MLSKALLASIHTLVIGVCRFAVLSLLNQSINSLIGSNVLSERFDTFVAVVVVVALVVVAVVNVITAAAVPLLLLSLSYCY